MRKSPLFNLAVASALLLTTPAPVHSVPETLGLGPNTFESPPQRRDGQGAYLADASTGPHLLLRSGAFDPLAGEPAIHAEMRRALASTQSGLRLIQFSGPIQAEWHAAMSTAGLQVVTYIADYGYLVWGNATAVERLGVTAPLRWSGPYHPFYALHPALADAAKLPAEVDVIIQVYDHPGAEKTVQAILDQAVAVTRAPHQVLTTYNLGVRMASSLLAWLASLPDVVNIEPRPQYRMLDEIQGQIVAGNLNAEGSQPSGTGYLAWLTGTIGFTTTPSAYPIVDVTDDGIDDGTATPRHPDFYTFGITTTADRLIYNVNWTRDAAADSLAGHGNINASIVAGYNDRTGFPYEDGSGYNYGLGINPFGRVAGSKVFNNAEVWDLPGDNYTALISQTYALGGRISSNSWGASTGGAYTIDDQAYDVLVRDAQPGGGVYDGNQGIVIVFAASNDGPGANTTGTPGNAKNVITVGAAESYRPDGTDGCNIASSGADNAQDIIGFSSRGPTDDSRVKPDIVAPGTHIQGAASQDPGYNGGGVCGGSPNPPNKYYPAGQTLYTWSSGTSHSTPAIAGAASLIYRYYQDHFGLPPSPAMMKAYMVNATRYLTGTGAGGNLPSNDQGYGEIRLGRAFDGVPRMTVDQSRVFTATGQVYTLTGVVADPSRPFRVTLAWTDAPGPTVGAAYVNNLDLQVTIGGQTYKGNVFSGDTSATGGSADTRNNLESVFLPAGQSGPFTVRITAALIAGDGVPGNGDLTWDQDFALVVYNAGQELGYLDGVVHDGTLGGALERATVRAITGTLAFTDATDATGYYTMTVTPDTYAVSAWKYGYAPQTITDVAVLSHTITTVNFTLTQTSLYSLTGCITDSVTGAPLSATVSVLGPFGDPITQTGAPQATGCYTLSLSGGPYLVTAQARLHQLGVAPINLVTDTVQDFALTATTTDGLLWGHVTDLITGDPLAGATIQVTPGPASITSGADGYYEIQIPSGVYTVTVSAPLHSTAVETDVVVPQSSLVERNYALPAAHMALLPPEGIGVTLRLGKQASQTLTISNAGPGELEFEILESRRIMGGGSDPFGYAFWDSRNSQGSSFAWIDATDGTPLSLVDDGEANVAVPFPFTFYGTPSTALRVGNNGGVIFGATTGDLLSNNTPLGTATTNNLIVPFWDDLGDTAGNVYYKTVGAAPNRRFIVEWYNRPHWTSKGDVGNVTFELILYEGTNNLKLQYQDVVFGNSLYDYGASATVGIRQSGSNYLQYSYNSPVLANSMAICFQYPGSQPCDPVDIPWLGVSPVSGSVAAGASLPVSVTFDAAVVTQTGVYTGVLRFYTNDPQAQPYLDYPVTMTALLPLPSFTIAKVPSSDRAEVGWRLLYTITVTNAGGLATGVVFSDAWPTDTLYAWASGGGARVGGDVVWSGLSAEANSTLQVSYAVTVTCVASGTHIVNDDYQVYANEWPTPTFGSPVTATAKADGVAPGFTWYTPVISNHPASFVNQSQYADAYAWTFGDGGASAAVNPAHTYTQSGVYTVTLTASNICSTGTYSQTLTVQDRAYLYLPLVTKP